MEKEKRPDTKDIAQQLNTAFSATIKEKELTPETLLQYAEKTIKEALPIFQSKTQEAYRAAIQIKRSIKDFYNEAVAPEYAKLKNITDTQAEEILTKETGKLFKNLRGSPYCGGKNAYSLFLDDIKNYNNEHDYKCPLFSATTNIEHGVIFPVSTLSIIAGRPSTGKTTALVSVAMQAIRDEKNKNVLFITTEETRNQLILRFIKNQFCFNCLHGKTQEQKDFVLSSDKESNYITQTFKNIIKENLNQTPELIGLEDTKITLSKEIYRASEEVKAFIQSGRLQIYDLMATESFSELEEVLNEQDPYTIVLLDYIQNLPHSAINAEASTSGFSQEIRKSMQLINDAIKANELIGITGAQLNREGANESKPEPLDLSKMGDSGSLERIAHIAIGLGRRINNNDPDPTNKRKDYFYSVLKDREGTTTGMQFKLVSDYYGYSYLEPDTIKQEPTKQINIDRKEPQEKNNKIINNPKQEKPKSAIDLINQAY